MADINQFKRNFSSFFSTFKETSFDSENSVNLCIDETEEVINFDKILELKYPNSNDRPKSFDALYIDDRDIYCVEFKNQNPNIIKKKSKDIQDKFQEGRDELDKFLAKENIQKNDYNFIYCVVYKKCIEKRDRYKCGVEKGKVIFGLDKYKESGLVKDIFTDNVEFFTRAFKLKIKKELSC